MSTRQGLLLPAGARKKNQVPGHFSESRKGVNGGHTSRRHKRASFLIINYEMEKGPEEARKLGFGYDDLEGTVEHPDWNRYQAAGSARQR